MLVNTRPPDEKPSGALLDNHVEPFLDHLRAKGYAERTQRKKRSVAASFARWSGRRGVNVASLRDGHVAAFIGRSQRRSKTREKLEVATLRQLLGYLRHEGAVPPAPPRAEHSGIGELLQRYVDYLRNERGLADRSIYIYSSYVLEFLRDRVKRRGPLCPGGLDAVAVREFLLDRVRDRSSEYARLLAATLRSFLGFLYLRGETTIDLSRCVPTVRRWSQAAVPSFLSGQEVEQVLSATPRSTPRGRRDHAILLLLARLGLRAGEVVALELGDIRWRTGEIVVRGKGRFVDHLPLLVDVGQALELYLRTDRGGSTSRCVFLRMLAPRVGLAGPAAVGGVVRTALARAGVRRAGRGAAHLFRHSRATRMMHNGASLAEISEALRHRSHNPTEIYAKVDFQALRGVARAWPIVRGAR